MEKFYEGYGFKLSYDDDIKSIYRMYVKSYHSMAMVVFGIFPEKTAYSHLECAEPTQD